MLKFIVVSGLFGKTESELLPPPPPFPDIEEEMEKEEIKEKNGSKVKHHIKSKDKKSKGTEKEISEIPIMEPEEMHIELETGKPKEDISDQRDDEKDELNKELDELDHMEGFDFEQDSGKPQEWMNVEKPKEVVNAEKEIEKAISGIKKKPPIVKRLFQKKEEENVEMPGVMPKVKERVDPARLIEAKIHKARLALMDFKFDDAKRLYIGVMRIYNDLDDKRKGDVYNDIKDLYYERKSAEKFSN